MTIQVSSIPPEDREWFELAVNQAMLAFKLDRKAAEKAALVSFTEYYERENARIKEHEREEAEKAETIKYWRELRELREKQRGRRQVRQAHFETFDEYKAAKLRVRSWLRRRGVKDTGRHVTVLVGSNCFSPAAMRRRGRQWFVFSAGIGHKAMAIFDQLVNYKW